MRTGLVLKYIGAVLLLDSAFMLLSAGISWINGMDSGFTPLFLSFLLTAILGMFPTLFVRRREQINAKEGYCIVTGAWLLSCFVGTFPYLLYGGDSPRPVPRYSPMWNRCLTDCSSGVRRRIG